MPMGAARSATEILLAIQKPLRFASKDDFAHVGTIRGLEVLCSTVCAEAHANQYAGLLKLLDSIKTVLAGFDSLPIDEKKGRIKAALDILDKGVETDAPQGIPTPSLEAKSISKKLELMRTPLRSVRGIGPKLSERLSAKGLNTVEDVLWFLPIRYEDRRNLKKIRELVLGESVAIYGEVAAFGEARYGRRRVFEAALTDGTGYLILKWFNYRLPYMQKKFEKGQRLVAFGQVGRFGQRLEIIHPDIETLDDGETIMSAGALVPIYSQIDNMHQKTIRKIVGSVVEEFAAWAPSGVPLEVLMRRSFMPLSVAFREAHLPSPDTKAQSFGPGSSAIKSLVFDELFMLELGMAMRRASIKAEPGFAHSGALLKDTSLESKLRALLPFKLTKAQERVLGELRRDMSDERPMNRLVQGDVGSGKTVVSFIASLWARDSGYQSAIMAPTEILAEQHYLMIKKYADSLGINCCLLTGSLKKSERRAALNAIASGEVDIVVGTHALIQDGVEFKKLGFATIDEQHRFGVVQRGELKKKGFLGKSPDILVMTATPIPRTLGMTVFADLDVSIIDELPPGRTPVRTIIIREKERARAYEAIRGELKKTHQAYIVYPLVEESGELPLKDATRMAEHLSQDIFPDFKVALLHGKMKAAQKEQTMRDFKDRHIDLLVSTTVIEVGVDVPNATVMMIEHAERFGLAQIHQLRGRVGRSEKRSLCLLLAQWTASEDTYKRLKVLEETCDGFKIAEKDLEIRGPGDFLGTRQSGMPGFKTKYALADLSLLKTAREEAMGFLSANQALYSEAAHPVKDILKARWEGRLELANTY